MHTCWEERKFQREQVGVAIAIYQDDFDLPHASVITAEIHWMDQASFQLIIICIRMPRCSNSTTPKYLQSKIVALLQRVHLKMFVFIENKLKCIISSAMPAVCVPTRHCVLSKVKQR